MPVTGDWRARVFAERIHLETKIAALKAFIQGAEAFGALPPEDQDLLLRQCAAMEAYSEVLKLRIEGGV